MENSKDPTVELFTAIRKNDLDAVKAAIAHGANLDTDGIPTLLKSAIQYRHSDVACALISAGANIHAVQYVTCAMLPIAAAMGDSKVVCALLDAGGNPQDKDWDGLTALEAAEEKGRDEPGRDEVVAILKKAGGGAQRNTPDLQLLAAAEDGDLETVRKLIKARANLEAADQRKNSYGMTPLMLAASEGHLEVFTALLEAGANPNARAWGEEQEKYLADMIKYSGEENIRGSNVCCTALMYAAEGGHAGIVQALLKAGADVNATGYVGHTALMMAANEGSSVVVAELIKAGADVNAVNAARSSALHFAVEAGDVETVKLLVVAGAKTEKKNKDGNTPLAVAASKGHTAVVQVLAKTAAKPKKTGKAKVRRGALVAAAGATHEIPEPGRRGVSITVSLPEEQIRATVTALLEAGADPNDTDKDGMTALMKAARAGHLEVARLLLAAGADAKVKEKLFGNTALHSAIGTSKQMVALLLEHGADVNEKDRDLRIPLFYAAWPEVAAMLLANGSNITSRDKDGNTLLHWRVMCGGQLEVLKQLLDAGVNINAPNDKGETPLAIALRHLANSSSRSDRKKEKAKDEKVVEFLRRHGAVEKAELAQDQKMRVAAKEREESRKWGPETPIPDFSGAAGTPEFKTALKRLAKVLKCEPEADEQVKGAFSFDAGLKDEELRTVQSDFAPLGCFVFRGKINPLGDTQIFALPTADKYQALAAMQTNGANYGIGPGAIIAWLKETEREQPFALLEIGYDVVAGQFLAPIANPSAMAKRMYELCPDIVDQGTETVAALAKELRKTNRLYLWWD